jgi:Arc/MetJ-type ribon-helix-helix transcriptional regulator
MKAAIEMKSGRYMSRGEVIENVIDRIEGETGDRNKSRERERERELWRGLVGKKACQPLVTSSSLS